MAFAVAQLNSNNSGATPQANLTVALTGVGAGNLIAVWTKHEGATVGVSVSDGTTTLTAATKTTHGNGDLEGQWHYLLSANSGNKTYTMTFAGGVSRPFLAMIVYECSDAGNTFTLDGENGTSGNGTAITSNNFTTTATDGITFGGYAEYSTDAVTNQQVNGVAATLTQLSGNTFTAAWRRTFSAGFTGAATATIASAQDWVVRGIAFKATSGTQSFSYTASGGITMGGASAVAKKDVPAVTGGLSLAGTSPQVKKAVKAALGGIQLGGTAAVSTHESTRIVQAAGGLQLGGAAGYSTFTVGGGTIAEQSLSISIRIGI